MQFHARIGPLACIAAQSVPLRAALQAHRRAGDGQEERRLCYVAVLCKAQVHVGMRVADQGDGAGVVARTQHNDGSAGFAVRFRQ